MSRESENVLMTLFALTGIVLLYMAHASTTVKTWTLTSAFFLTAMGVVGVIFTLIGVTRIIWNVKNRKK